MQSSFVSILAAAALLTAPLPGAAQEFADVAPRVLSGVVHIAIGGPRTTLDPGLQDAPTGEALAMPAQRGPRAAGSGFVIGQDGYILTVAHLFDRPGDPVLVRLGDEREFPARIVGRDRRTDVALLKIEATGLTPLTIGDPHRLRLAERVYALGRLPAGLDAVVTDGIVSAAVRPREDKSFVPFIQVTAPLYPAMGGGPLVNRDGAVVGVSAMVYSRQTGVAIAFAVPIDIAMRVADELRAAGRVQRGTLGVVVKEPTAEVLAAAGLPRPAGALIASVQKDMPAARAGIVPGDIILRVGGEEVRSPNDLVRLVARARPGDRLTLELRRVGGQTEKVEVRVAEAGD